MRTTFKHKRASLLHILQKNTKQIIHICVFPILQSIFILMIIFNIFGHEVSEAKILLISICSLCSSRFWLVACKYCQIIVSQTQRILWHFDTKVKMRFSQTHPRQLIKMYGVTEPKMLCWSRLIWSTKYWGDFQIVLVKLQLKLLWNCIHFFKNSFHHDDFDVIFNMRYSILYKIKRQ